jgi:pimeloyl-ACP methyl ester carboxylesterase
MMPEQEGPEPLQVKAIGSFHIGGGIRTLTGLPVRQRVSTPGGPTYSVDPNGEISVGQMYVQFVRLAAPRTTIPLLMWHGGGMTGANWETTPDGRPGWQWLFLRAGLDVFVSDAVERGRSGFAPYPDVYAEAPYFRTAKEAWEKTFRLGPAGSYHRDSTQRRARPDCRFPLASFDTFMKQSVPRWDCNDALTQVAYDALVTKVGDCFLLMHSQGGNFGLHAALAAPNKVKAVIAVEPSGAPDPAKDDPSLLRDVPHLFIWGDHLEGNDFWAKYQPGARRWYEALLAAGVPATWIELPKLGIRGNSHALMMDDNSDQIAGMIMDWLIRMVPGAFLS